MTRPLTPAFLTLLIQAVAFAQSPTKPPRPSFEVASVKLATLAPGQRPAQAGCTPATGRYVAPGRGVWLVVAKNGVKIEKKAESDAGNVVKINGVPGYAGQNGWTMPQLAEFLARNFPGQVVVDRTGLEGFYKITLDYEILPGTSPGDALFAELQRQLGLKLEARKESVETIVVDRLEKAGDN